MKKCFLVASGLLSLSSNLFANTPVRINNVAVTSMGVCNPGEICPAVEPWREVNFTHTSCAKQQLELNVQETEDSLKVEVVGQGYDCMGPMIERTYNLQMPFNFPWKPIQVLNYIEDIRTGN